MQHKRHWISKSRQSLALLAAAILGQIGVLACAYVLGAAWLVIALIWTIALTRIVHHKHIPQRFDSVYLYQVDWIAPLAAAIIAACIYFVVQRQTSWPIDINILTIIVAPPIAIFLAKHFLAKFEMYKYLASKEPERELEENNQLFTLPPPPRKSLLPPHTQELSQLVNLLVAWKPRWTSTLKNAANVANQRLTLGERGECGLLAQYLSARQFQAVTEVPLLGNLRSDLVVLNKYIIEAKQDLGGLIPLSSLKEKIDKYTPLLDKYELIILIFGIARADLEDRLIEESHVHFKYLRLGKKVIRSSKRSRD